MRVNALTNTASRYSTFRPRFVACVIDALILLGLLELFGLGPPPGVIGFDFSNGWVWLVVGVYYIATEGVARASIGKILTAQTIVDKRNRPITLLQACNRTLAKPLTIATFMLGFLTILFTKKKQAIHDLIARTYVVKR